MKLFALISVLAVSLILASTIEARRTKHHKAKASEDGDANEELEGGAEATEPEAYPEDLPKRISNFRVPEAFVQAANRDGKAPVASEGIDASANAADGSPSAGKHHGKSRRKTRRN